MYKSNLQELCQRRAWSLPTYTCSKEGQEHNPRFKSSVTIDGISFHSNILYRSSKESQNEVAKLALRHFASVEGGGAPPSSDASSSAETKSNETKKGGTLSPPYQETNQHPEIRGNTLDVKDDKEIGGMKHPYKTQLQIYAQRKNLSPEYSFERDGQPHDLRFKAKVTVDGQSFESSDYFHTLKEAEHSAAKAALMALSPDCIQEDDSSLAKNLLQEMAQKEGICLPIYKTVRSGASHSPTFFSTVEFGGETFHGKEAKSKKQAEMNAASVAFTAFKERRLNRSCKSLSPGCQASEALEDASNSNITTSFPYDKLAELRKDESQEGNSAKTITINTKNSSPSFQSPQKPGIDMTSTKKGWPSSPDMVYVHLRDPFPLESSSSEDDLSPTAPSEPSSLMDNKGLPTEKGSVLLSRVRVYPRMPDMNFPEGITVLPISDDKWVAVSLDFPNEESN